MKHFPTYTVTKLPCYEVKKRKNTFEDPTLEVHDPRRKRIQFFF